jgi:hypothetical protein
VIKPQGWDLDSELRHSPQTFPLCAKAVQKCRPNSHISKSLETDVQTEKQRYWLTEICVIFTGLGVTSPGPSG